MDKVQAKIDELLAADRTNRRSISELRTELKASGNFSDDEVSEICRAYSDADLNQLNQNSKSILSYFDSIYIAYALCILFAILSVIAIFAILELRELQVVAEVPNSMLIWRYFLLAGSVLFLIRNLYRVVNHFKSKK